MPRTKGTFFEGFVKACWWSLKVNTIILAAALLIILTGCQNDFNVGFSSKIFHPDNSNGKPVGDPRKGMYDGSGYHETINGGSVGQSSGFRTIGDAH